jgi:hypothetical protein
MQMTWQYLAGLFDGEGTLHTPLKRTGRVRWSIAQSLPGRPVLLEAQAFLQEQQIKAAVIPNRYHYKGEPKIMYVLAVSRMHDVQRICGILYPYLRVKRVPVLDAWRFLTLYPKRH